MKYQQPISPNPFHTLLMVALVSLMANEVKCQLSITATGSWSKTLTSADVPDAGTDITGTHTSASNQVLIDVEWPQKSNYRYRVTVRKSDVSWNASLLLYVKRTGNGTGQRTISGGTSYILLSSTNQTFFTGNRDRFNVPIQFQITGVSVLIPAQTYSTTVIYTVTEI